ncbi:MAG TPA: MlaD family protein [Geminicoccaceae bacterium]|nr:MlaD family protein [Geminicoccaceae bacterium]
MQSSLDRKPSAPEPVPPLPEVAVKRRKGPSAVWAVPVVAAVIGGYLAWVTLAERGPEITIAFATAEGLEPGKTRVKYKDVEVGLVEQVTLSSDLRQIVVTARMEKGVAPYVNEGTRFWVVRPRIGAGGVSGLSTLVSGAYVEMDPGQGRATSRFTGLEEPPLILQDVPGQRFVLRADQLGSISRGAPVYFRGIEVGQVLGYKLAPDNDHLVAHIFVHAPHDQMVRENSRFWNASGITFSTGADGVQVELASLQALIAGGIEFDTPPQAVPAPVAAAEHTFSLFDSFSAVTDAAYTRKTHFLAYFDGSVRGLRPGAPVEMRGLRLGTVTEVRLAYDPATGHIRVPVTFEIQPERLIPDLKQAELEDDSPAARQDRASRLVDQGLRAQLQTGSLLTGELLVSLDFHPDAPPEKVTMEGDLPVVPTVPTQLDTLSASLTTVLNNVASLPLNELVADLRNTIQGIEQLVAAPETKASVASLNSSLGQLEVLLQRLSGQIDPLTASLLRGLDQAGAAMVQARGTFAAAEGFVGADSKLRYDLAGVLKELQTAARSIRVFADYLERHPEALIRGKGGSTR